MGLGRNLYLLNGGISHNGDSSVTTSSFTTAATCDILGVRVANNNAKQRIFFNFFIAKTSLNNQECDYMLIIEQKKENEYGVSCKF